MHKPVLQEDVTGCALASVAVLTGIAYRKVKSAARSLGIAADDPKLWSDTAHMRSLLAYFKIRTRRSPRPFRSWTALPDLALLAIKWHLEKGQPCWHWVVFIRLHDRPNILDSNRRLRSHRRTDFGRIKPKWYLEIRSPSLLQ